MVVLKSKNMFRISKEDEDVVGSVPVEQQVSNIEGSEVLDNTELVTAENEVNQDLEKLDAVVDTGQEIVDLKEKNEEKLQTSPQEITQADVIATEKDMSYLIGKLHGLGMNIQPNKFVNVGLEAANAAPIQAFEIQQEGIGQTIKDFFVKIWEWIKKVFTNIKNFFKKLFGNSEKKEEKITETVKASGGDSKTVANNVADKIEVIENTPNASADEVSKKFQALKSQAAAAKVKITEAKVEQMKGTIKQLEQNKTLLILAVAYNGRPDFVDFHKSYEDIMNIYLYSMESLKSTEEIPKPKIISKFYNNLAKKANIDPMEDLIYDLQLSNGKLLVKYLSNASSETSEQKTAEIDYSNVDLKISGFARMALNNILEGAKKREITKELARLQNLLESMEKDIKDKTKECQAQIEQKSEEEKARTYEILNNGVKLIQLNIMAISLGQRLLVDLLTVTDKLLDTFKV